MPDHRTLVQQWMNGDTIPGVRFRLNDSVEILSGPPRGNIGAIISPVIFEPEPVYIVELATGGDVRVAQRELRPAT